MRGSRVLDLIKEQSGLQKEKLPRISSDRFTTKFAVDTTQTRYSSHFEMLLIILQHIAIFTDRIVRPRY